MPACPDEVEQTAPFDMPRCDWPLIGDVQTVRAGVPEAWLLWRRIRGETDPLPSDPGFTNR